MKNLFYPLIAVLIFFTIQSHPQQISVNKGNSTIQGNPIRAYINLNNISTIFKNDGISDINVSQTNAGFVYPFGSGKTTIYQSGLLWGIKISGDPQVRVGGSVYRSGLQGGKIISPGVAEDPSADHVRIYRVRPDVYPGGPIVDLSREALDEGKSETEVRNQYETDWTEWRGIDGAPYTDVNENGIYDPNVDIPGIEDAVQTIWFVANDLDTAKVSFMSGTLPIGIEYQATLWEYKDSVGFNNLFFRKYKLINKGLNTFDSMYISMFSDPDVGDAGDDFVGCDTLLNLGFAYNAFPTDLIYGNTPPAVGFDLIRGPLVPGIPGEDRNRNGIDDAFDYGLTENNKMVFGFINLPMTAFYYLTIQDPYLADPPPGSSEGATQFYNFMQGKIGQTGENFINPITNLPTTFALSGDPITGMGWIDGIQLPAGDRRLGLSTGPFQMAPGDTQIVVIAEIAGGVVAGVSNLGAITLMKYYSQIAQEFYDTIVPIPVFLDGQKLIPSQFKLSQNYPNPFNPTTIIKYQIPKPEFISLKVYDILGREVVNLVNEEKLAGSYEVQFDGSGLTSGIYFYKFKASNYSETMKMILMK